MFRVPYRWSKWWCWKANLLHIWCDLYNGVCNVFRWIPVIWYDADYDWCYLASIMEYKLWRMAKVFENGRHTNAWKDAKTTKVCAELLKRMREDRYFHNAGYDSDTWNTKSNRERKRIAEHAANQEKQDEDYLGKIFGKNLRRWWD